MFRALHAAVIQSMITLLAPDKVLLYSQPAVSLALYNDPHPTTPPPTGSIARHNASGVAAANSPDSNSQVLIHSSSGRNTDVAPRLKLSQILDKH